MAGWDQLAGCLWCCHGWFQESKSPHHRNKKPWKYTSTGEGLKFPCKWTIVKTTDNIRLISVAMVTMIVMGIEGQRSQGKANDCNSKKTKLCVWPRDHWWRGPAEEGYGTKFLLAEITELCSVYLRPQHTHIPRPIEDLEKDPFCPPYPQSSLLKWLPWPQLKNLLNCTSSILNDAILFCQINNCNYNKLPLSIHSLIWRAHLRERFKMQTFVSPALFQN